MKKVLVLLFTVAVAFSLTMPAFVGATSAPQEKKEEKKAEKKKKGGKKKKGEKKEEAKPGM
jgi:ribosomal protein L12E/L44/L45/RPP1/RPP2